MKLAFYLLLILAAFKVSSSGSDLITESCKEASKEDPNISYAFCVASFVAMIPSPPSSVEELVAMTIQMTKSKATNVVYTISILLKDHLFSDYAKKCLKDCSDHYLDSLSDLGDALGAFRSKDFNSATAKISAAMGVSVTCEDQFKEGKEKSPLTDDNKVYFELNAMSQAFLKMHK
ncbi:putative invertase inhibitor [Neltuma alba]|uniref:putative invertase inhibitor n=1 Tax=Neltuma alba TaxID=207710 RepID=UPI0010A30354|nr:putative invertase inhibitor [Prosopis alba]